MQRLAGTARQSGLPSVNVPTHIPAIVAFSLQSAAAATRLRVAGATTIPHGGVSGWDPGGAGRTHLAADGAGAANTGARSNAAGCCIGEPSLFAMLARCQPVTLIAAGGCCRYSRRCSGWRRHPRCLAASGTLWRRPLTLLCSREQQKRDVRQRPKTGRYGSTGSSSKAASLGH